MSNVYTVRLASPVKMQAQGHHFSGKETSYLFVVASSFDNAIRAVEEKYPGAQIRGIEMLNYVGVPIVVGD